MAGRIAAGGIYFLLWFTPFAFGGVEPWAHGVVQVVAGVVVAAWALDRRAAAGPDDRDRAARGLRRLLWVPIGLFVLLVVIQLVPLPPAWIERLSPGVHRLYTHAVPGYAAGRDFDAEELIPWLLADQHDRIPASGEEPSAGTPGAPGPPGAPDTPLALGHSPARTSAWRTLSIDPFRTRRTLMLLLCYIGLFAAATDLFRARERQGRLLAVAAVAGVSVTLVGIIGRLTGGGALMWLREGEYAGSFGPFVNRNSYAAFAGTILPLTIGLALAAAGRMREDARRARRRILLWSIAALVIAGGVLLSGSRTGIVTAALASSALLVPPLRPGRSPARIAMLTVIVAWGVGLLLRPGPEETIGRAGALSELQGMPSFASRAGAWRRAVEMIADHRGFGTGLGTFGYGFMRYAPPGEGWWRRAHNEYLELLCDTGLTGGIIVLAGFAGFLLRVARRPLSEAPGDRRATLGIMAGLAGLLCHSAVSSNLQVPANGLLLAVLGAALLGPAGNPDRRDVPRPAPSSVARARWFAVARSRSFVVVALVVLVALNSASAIVRAVAFAHRHRGLEAMARADLDGAYAGLAAAAAWEPGDASGYFQLGRVVELALANRLRLDALPWSGPRAGLGAGVGAFARGLALNPADASGWLGLAALYRGARAARVGAETPWRAGAARRVPAEEPAPPDAPDPAGVPAPAAAGAAGTGGGLDPEDRVAVAAAHKAIELEPGAFRQHDFLLRLYWERGLREEAAREMRLSVALMPRRAAHAWIQDTALESGLGPAILEGLDQAASNRFIRPFLTAQARAEFLEDLRLYPEAILAFVHLRGLGGAALAAECDLAIGRMELRRGRTRESLPILERVVGGGPGSEFAIAAHYYLGQAYARLEDHHRAVEHLRVYVAQRPENLPGRLGLASGLDALGQNEAADRIYREAVLEFPESPEAHRRLIAFLIRRGEPEEARPFAAALSRIDPGSDATRSVLRQLDAAAAPPPP